MKLFQETTKWPDATPNHAYYLDDSKTKMYAYIRAGDRAVFRFKNFIRIDTRGRQFKEIADPNNFVLDEPVANLQRWQVTGSKGDKYVVTLEENQYNCTCSGFRFRGSCRHVKQFEGK
jgi:hypothetical protein